MEAKIFKALGDPLRLKIIKKLSSGIPCTMGEITSGFNMSRQGVRKQVGVLENAKIVQLHTKGREIMVILNPNSLKIGKEFMLKLEAQWDSRLKKLKEVVEDDISRK